MLLGALILGGVVSVAWQGRPPDTRTAVSIEAALLPPLPETAGPDGAPAQTDVRAQTVDLGGGFFATLMHGYVLEGEVVTRRAFWTDAVSAVSPLDLGIVWGELGAGGATESVRFSAGFRMVSYQAEPGAALPRHWEEQITNNHLIPASAAVHDALTAVVPGQRVRLRGYLVTVTGDGIRPWRSSTRRDDNTIYGGCEIILVRDVEILPEATPT